MEIHEQSARERTCRFNNHSRLDPRQPVLPHAGRRERQAHILDHESERRGVRRRARVHYHSRFLPILIFRYKFDRFRAVFEEQSHSLEHTVVEFQLGIVQKIRSVHYQRRARRNRSRNVDVRASRETFRRAVDREFRRPYHIETHRLRRRAFDILRRALNRNAQFARRAERYLARERTACVRLNRGIADLACRAGNCRSFNHHRSGRKRNLRNIRFAYRYFTFYFRCAGGRLHLGRRGRGSGCCVNRRRACCRFDLVERLAHAASVCSAVLTATFRVSGARVTVRDARRRHRLHCANVVHATLRTALPVVLAGLRCRKAGAALERVALAGALAVVAPAGRAVVIVVAFIYFFISDFFGRSRRLA